MLPIFSASNIRQWDEFTVKNEPISSIDLMERAAIQCVDWISKNILKAQSIAILCGNGNNGGDGLAIARHLYHLNYDVCVYIENVAKRSVDSLLNLERITQLGTLKILKIDTTGILNLSTQTVIIDCIFGIGLNKKVEGFWALVIEDLNKSEIKIISIDIPSGLLSEPSNTVDLSQQRYKDTIIKAHTTLTFQAPKLSMLIPGWGDYCGHLQILDIGLHPDFLKTNLTNTYFIQASDIKEKLKPREKFAHKGTYGHALIIAGSQGKCGAAILSSKATLKSGAGLVTVFTHSECSHPIHAAIPEAMVEINFENLELEKYKAIGIGPGIGTDKQADALLMYCLQKAKTSLVLDADALTLIARKEILDYVPPLTIITPHPKEFDRLAGESNTALERLDKAKIMAKEKNILVVLKGAYTAICLPTEECFFNSTGNPGMAKAGSGDVLTGIITSFLAQGYAPMDAAILGVFIHGKAGDFAAKNKSVAGMLASDIIDNLDEVFKELESKF